jgi:hypothetical protein
MPRAAKPSSAAGFTQADIDATRRPSPGQTAARRTARRRARRLPGRASNRGFLERRAHDPVDRRQRALFHGLRPSKVPIDVSMGNAAAGIAIDFYGRFQAQVSRAPDGTERMALSRRGAARASVAIRSACCAARPTARSPCASWNLCSAKRARNCGPTAPGTPGGPEKYALRRVPIRREFYPSTRPGDAGPHEEHNRNMPPTISPTRPINPYALAEQFTYVSPLDRRTLSSCAT